MTEERRTYWKVAIQTVLLALGMYFFIRIIRNNLYYSLISPVEQTSPAVHQILIYLGHALFFLGFALYFWAVRDERPIVRGLFKNRKAALAGAVGGLLAGFAMNAFCILVAVLHGDIDMVWAGGSAPLLILSFFAVVIQASAEEYHYRAFACGRIRASAPATYAVLASAFSFGYVHLLNNGVSLLAFVNIVLIGILYALVLCHFNNFAFCCAHHTTWNYTQNFIFGLPNSGTAATLTMMNPTHAESSIVYNADFGVEGAAVATILNIAVIVIVLIMARRKTEAAAQ